MSETGEFKKALFICTGNYYRSRFAEAVFNHHASRLKIPWKAISRGLATYLVRDHLSRDTVGALKARGIELNNTSERCTQLDERDLEGAERWIGLQEVEHRPMMAELFPTWSDKIDYWDIKDVDDMHPDLVLPELEHKVLKLIEECWLAEGAPAAPPHKKG